MKVICSLICCCLLATYLGAAPRQTSAIRLHGVMESDGIEANLSVISKDQNKIKATISNALRSAVVEIYFTEDSIRLHKQLPDGTTQISRLTDDDAAIRLLDLLCFNPEYHFQKADNFDVSTPVLDGYTLVLTRARSAIAGTEVFPPKSISIVKEVGDKTESIRTVRYLEFMEDTKPYLQPRRMEFFDEESGRRGTITIKRVEYNPGLPDFLFEVPKAAN